jgi:hypothetical protein
MSKETNLAAADPKPTALKKGVRQFSSRVGGGASSRSRRHRKGTAAAASIQPRSGTPSDGEPQGGVVPALGQSPPLSSQ